MRSIDADTLVAQLSDKAKEMLGIAEQCQGSAINYYTGAKYGFAKAAIIANGLQTIDAVPVVRCKYCKHWGMHKRLNVPWCFEMHIDKSEDGYCDSGERSEASICDNCDQRNDKGCCVCKYIKERSEDEH